MKGSLNFFILNHKVLLEEDTSGKNNLIYTSLWFFLSHLT